MFVALSTILLLFASTAYSQIPIVSEDAKQYKMCLSDTTPSPHQSVVTFLYGEDVYKTWHFEECLSFAYDGQAAVQGTVCRSAVCEYYPSSDCSGDPFKDPVFFPAGFTGPNVAETIELIYGNSANCIPSNLPV